MTTCTKTILRMVFMGSRFRGNDSEYRTNDIFTHDPH